MKPKFESVSRCYGYLSQVYLDSTDFVALLTLAWLGSRVRAA